MLKHRAIINLLNTLFLHTYFCLVPFALLLLPLQPLFFGPIVQGIEQKFPKLQIQVRVLVGLLSMRVMEEWVRWKHEFNGSIVQGIE